MPIDYSYDHKSQIIVVIAVGFVSVEDRAKFVSDILGDDEMPDAAPILIDASRVSNAPEHSNSARISMLIQMLLRRFQGRIAYWVTGVGMVTPFAITAMAAGSNKVQAFTNRDSAIAWLKDEPLYQN